MNTCRPQNLYPSERLFVSVSLKIIEKLHLRFPNDFQKVMRIMNNMTLDVMDITINMYDSNNNEQNTISQSVISDLFVDNFSKYENQ